MLGKATSRCVKYWFMQILRLIHELHFFPRDQGRILAIPLIRAEICTLSMVAMYEETSQGLPRME